MQQKKINLRKTSCFSITMDSSSLPDTLNKNWKNDKSGFGFRMLQKMGWKEDKGLGKDGSGIVDSLKVRRLDNGIGLGMEALADTAGDKTWSATTTSLNAVLDILKQSYKKNDVSNEENTPKKRKIIHVGIK